MLEFVVSVVGIKTIKLLMLYLISRGWIACVVQI